MTKKRAVAGLLLPSLPRSLACRTIALDLATYRAGFAINADKDVFYGEIKTGQQDPLPVRLKQIYQDLTELISEYSPAYMVSEDQFVYKNPKTLKVLAAAQGVAMLAAAQHKILFSTLSPKTVKEMVAGTGKAKKKDMVAAVQQLFSLTKDLTDNEADALAILYSFWKGKKQCMI